MEYARGHQQAQEIAKGIFMTGAKNPVPERTLAARLEDANSTIANQCGRIEDTLARINGTPRQAQSEKADHPTPSIPLSGSVENTESLAKRLCDLACSLERVG